MVGSQCRRRRNWREWSTTGKYSWDPSVSDIDLSQRIFKCDHESVNYTEDFTIMMSETVGLQQRVSHVLESVESWCSNNGLILINAKTDCTIFKTSYTNTVVPPALGINGDINIVVLGIIIDHNLN
ncbi:hypothetical protein HHI36_006995 [Cryptolaemus montrouzieri]|uniref:Reverse transcriptase domain-containing protein n=1 Tax=Cryptolaemus montrouzieri TaxID=559131 RepID=A0ABD2MND2_9CUCU